MGGLPRTKPQAPRAIERPIVVAMPKGRIMKESAAIFEAAGYDLSPLFSGSRKLIFDCGPLRVLVLRSSDVPTFVEYGAADVGIAGRDVLDEQGRDLYEPIDLGIGACRMMVAEPADKPVDVRSQMHLRIATKFPNITRRYLERRGVHAEIIKLGGAIELAPLTGLADQIVDIVQSGETLRQNGLVEVDTIMPVTSRLVVSPATLKLRPTAISELIAKLEKQVAGAAGGHGRPGRVA